MRLLGPTDEIADRLIGENVDAVHLFLIRTWLHTLLAIFLLWACLSTPVALPLSALVLLIHETATQAQIAAHNRAGREEIMRGRDAYAVMAERHLPSDPDDRAADAFRSVDASLRPEVGRPQAMGREGLRAIALNGALIFAAGAAGFLLRPEIAQTVAWLDALSPR